MQVGGIDSTWTETTVSVVSTNKELFLGKYLHKGILKAHHSNNQDVHGQREPDNKHIEPG
jgi:hypothetical protein